MQNKAGKHLLLLVIPFMFCIVGLRLKEAQGAYYFSHNSDPAYLYLINSLDIAMLRHVNHVDNPGTTVQILGGMVIRVLALFRGVNDWEADALLHPEYYLKAINNVLFSMNLMGIILLGIAAYCFSKNIGWALLFQCAPLSSWQMIKAIPMVSPEPMSIMISTFFIILLLWVIEKEIHLIKPAAVTVAFSVITALGLATKLTFLAYILIPMFILPGFKWKSVYLTLTVFIFHIILIPAYEHYDFLLHWVKLLLLHTESYGQGAAEIIDIRNAAFNLMKLLILEHPFFISLIIAIALLVFVFLNKKLSNSLGNPTRLKLLTAVTIAAVIHTLLVSKMYSPRYLIPFLMLFPLIIYLDVKTFGMIKKKVQLKISNQILWNTLLIIALALLLFIRHRIGYEQGETAEEWMRKISDSGLLHEWIIETFIRNSLFLLAFITVFISGVIMIYHHKIQREMMSKILLVCLIAGAALYLLRHIDITGLHQRMQNSKKEAAALIDLVENNYRGYIKIYGERSSSKFYALKYGTSTNFTEPKLVKRIAEIYPDEKIYFWGLKLGERYFENWTNRIPLSDIVRQSNDVIIQGNLDNLTPENLREIETRNNVKLMKIFQGSKEAVYLITE